MLLKQNTAELIRQRGQKAVYPSPPITACSNMDEKKNVFMNMHSVKFGT